MTKGRQRGFPLIWVAAGLAGIMAVILAVLSISGSLNPSTETGDAGWPWAATEAILVATSTPPPTATLSPTSAPSPTAIPPYSYTVQAGDTLWDIARRFDVTVDLIVAANPDLVSSELLEIGMGLAIPGVEADPDEIPEPEWPITARVTDDGGGLRLRTKPSLQGEILYGLAAQTPLTLVGRTQDNEWLAVRTPFLDGGWVKSDWVEVFIDLAEVPVTWYSTLLVVDETPSPGQPTAVPSTAPVGYAHVSGVTSQLREIYELGLSLGNRPNVFSKIGDSITVNSAFLTPFGMQFYDLFEHAYLQSVIDYYNGSWARTHNSFANVSLAAEVGWTSWRVITTGDGDADYCTDSETPLECEYRWVRPTVAIIMLGTNDVAGTAPGGYDYPLREIIETSLEKGIIPVLTTIPPMHRASVESRVLAYNQVVAELAQAYGIPMVDYWAALQGLPNDGLGPDGVHPSGATVRGNGFLNETNLQEGYPMRNLITLQALDSIFRIVIEAQ
ncbi:MAG TPA: LysM peptidoglycan-binding domain-containing protein [Anaerolineae bacterium]|nr:LysM peptidoglycan-binding domain-containing protein [Anaerolineae bacterium]